MFLKSDAPVWGGINGKGTSRVDPWEAILDLFFGNVAHSFFPQLTRVFLEAKCPVGGARNMAVVTQVPSQLFKWRVVGTVASELSAMRLIASATRR